MIPFLSGPAGPRRRFAGRTMGFLVLGAALFSSGCVVRYSHQDIDGSWYDDKLEREWVPPVELALMTNDIPLGPISATTFSLEYFRQGLDPRAIPPMHDWQSVSINSLMAAGRFYPWRQGPILAYAGGGFGRTSLSVDWTEYVGGGFDPLFRCVAFCDNTEDRSGTILSGWSRYVTAGVELRPPFMAPSLLFEYRKDMDRGDDFYELSGTSYSVGLRLQTR